MPTSDYDAALRSTYEQKNGRNSQAPLRDGVEPVTHDQSP